MASETPRDLESTVTIIQGERRALEREIDGGGRALRAAPAFRGTASEAGPAAAAPRPPRPAPEAARGRARRRCARSRAGYALTVQRRARGGGAGLAREAGRLVRGPPAGLQARALHRRRRAAASTATCRRAPHAPQLSVGCLFLATKVEEQRPLTTSRASSRRASSRART